MREPYHVKAVKNIISKSSEKWLSFVVIFRCDPCVSYLVKENEDKRKRKEFQRSLLEGEEGSDLTLSL